MSDNLSIQDDEINAIKSIYEENDIFLFDFDTRRGKFFAKQECVKPSQFLVNVGNLFSVLNPFARKQL
jgi:hypothetical protein